MIKELRKKFLFIFMFFVTILLLIIQVTFLFHYQQSDLLYKRQDSKSDSRSRKPSRWDNPKQLQSVKSRNQSTLGSIQILSNEWNQEESEILKMIQEVISSDSTSGIMPNYNVQYAIRETPYTRTIAFIDLTVSNSIQATITLRTLSSISLPGGSLCNGPLPIKKESWSRQEIHDPATTVSLQPSSHELRNPLAIISSNTDILASSTTPEQAKWLGYIRDETKRMNEPVSPCCICHRVMKRWAYHLSHSIWVNSHSVSSCHWEAIAYEQKKRTSNRSRTRHCHQR